MASLGLEEEKYLQELRASLQEEPCHPFETGRSTEYMLGKLSGTGGNPGDIHRAALQRLGYVAEDAGAQTAQREPTREELAYQRSRAAARGNKGPDSPYQKNVQSSSQHSAMVEQTSDQVNPWSNPQFSQL